MNVSREADSSGNILYVNFNQSVTTLCVGAKTGVTLYGLGTVNESSIEFSSRGLKDICIIERNFSSSLVAYVKLESPRKVVLFNITKDFVLIERSFPNTVLSVKLNRNNVVICLEDRIFLIYLSDLRNESMHVITNTATNVKGLIALSYGPVSSTSLLAYPGSSANGNVQIFDALKKLYKLVGVCSILPPIHVEAVHFTDNLSVRPLDQHAPFTDFRLVDSSLHATMTIPAHTSQLAALAFDEEGEKLATASIKGTVIRVFSVANGDILFEFRRGVKRCVEIQCLSFNKSPEMLCASSNTETIHIFKLCAAETIESVDEESEGWMDMFGRVLTQSAKYLPTQMSEVLTQQRSFAHVHLPFTDQKTICAITYIMNVPYVVVASVEGFMYIYDINLDVGGACHLVKQHRLEGPAPEHVNSSRNLDPKPLQSSTSCDVDPTACLTPQVINNHQEDDVPFLSFPDENVPELSCPVDDVPKLICPVDDVPELSESVDDVPELELCDSNGIHTTCDELPPILTEVDH